MNHSERIAETARRHRHLTRRRVKEAVETYLELLAEEIIAGEWVDIPDIGKIAVEIENGSGVLHSKDGQIHKVTRRLRTKIRLSEAFKERCYERIP